MEDNNIFMICRKLNCSAFKGLNKSYKIRNLKKSELEIWKAFPFDTNEDKEKYSYILDEYYNDNFSDREKEFYNSCKVICNENDEILGTCFLWKTKSGLWSIQWFKVINEYANKGIGRQLLSYIFREEDFEFPIILHTHPVSFAAIKLYHDFGFEFLINKHIGSRINHLNKSINFIKTNVKLNSIQYTSLFEKEKERLSVYQSEDF